MKFLINTATVLTGGSMQVALSFIEECKKYPENTYHFVLSPTIASKFNSNDYPQNFIFYDISFRPATRFFSFKSQSKFFKELETMINPDIVFTTSGPSYWRPKNIHVIGYNLAHYIYPDSPFFKKISKFSKYKWKLKGLLFKHLYNNDADVYIVQTTDVNERLKKWLNNNKPVYTVSNTCSNHYLRPVTSNNKLPPKKDSEFRLLLFSGYYLHKDFEIIQMIIDRMNDEQRNSIRFILTIENKVYKKLFPEPYRTNVINVGSINPDAGPSLYKECDAMFLPTLLECFSASYPEAMAMEKPIITSNMGFAKSICEDSALFFEPRNPDDALKKINDLFHNIDMQKELIIKGKARLNSFLSPEERAKEFLRICSEVVK